MSHTVIPVLADPSILEQQFSDLRFSSFGHDDGLVLGQKLVELAQEKGWAVALSVTLGAHEIFHYCLPGTTTVNDEWIIKKRNLVFMLEQPTFLIGQRLAAEGKTVEDLGVSEDGFAAYGGGYPIMVGDDMVGQVIVSGVPQQDDHALVVEALSSLLSR